MGTGRVKDAAVLRALHVLRRNAGKELMVRGLRG